MRGAGRQRHIARAREVPHLRVAGRAAHVGELGERQVRVFGVQGVIEVGVDPDAHDLRPGVLARGADHTGENAARKRDLALVVVL